MADTELPPLRYEYFEPRSVDLYESSVPLLGDTAIIIGNPLGSSIGNAEDGYGDTGRAAQAVSNRTGYPVIAFERPGSVPAEDAASTPSRSAIPPNISQRDIASFTGDSLAKALSGHGFDQTILAGNSAGGSAVIGLARSMTLPASHVSVMDPVGLTNHSPAIGFSRWLRHAIHENRRPTVERAIDDLPSQATGFQLSSFIYDTRTYHQSWLSGETGNDLLEIARTLGNVTIRIAWPRHTFSLQPEDMACLGERLTAIRDQSKGAVRPLRIVRDPGGHSQYNNFRIFASNIAKVIREDFPGYDQ